MASLLKNVGFNTLGFVGGKLAAGVAGILLLRALHPQSAGRYGAALGFATLFQALSDLGLEGALGRVISRDPGAAGRWWSVALLLDALQSAVVAVALGLFLWLGGSGPIPAQLVGLAYLVTRLAAVGMPTATALRALDRFGLAGALSAGASLLNAGALVCLLAFGHVSAEAALLATFASGLLGVLLWASAARRMGLRWTPLDWSATATFWRESLPFALTSVANLLYLRIDQVLLAWLVGSVALGYYVAAVKVSDLLSPVLVAIYGPIYISLSALMVRVETGDPQALIQVRDKLGRALRYMTTLSLPIGVGGSVLAVPLTRWLYGSAFAPAAYALGFMVWVPALLGIHGPLDTALNAAGKTPVLARWMLINLALNVGLNLWLVPRWGFLASAAISVLCEGLRLGVAWTLCQREGLVPAFRRVLWPALPAAVVMGGGLVLGLSASRAMDPHLQMALLLAAGGLLYGVALFVFGFWGPDERVQFRRFLGRDLPMPPRPSSDVLPDPPCSLNFPRLRAWIHVKRRLKESGKALLTYLPQDLGRYILGVAFPKNQRRLQRRRYGDGIHPGVLAPFDRNRCIFVHIPKCAGMSVVTSLFGGSVGGHHSMRYYRFLYSRRELDSYFKFTFVRNPYDRLVSAYHFLAQGGMNRRDRAWADVHLAPYRDFEDFVLRGLDQPENRRYFHFVPQLEFVKVPWRRRPPLDFIGRYESLDKDFSLVAQRLGRPAVLGKINQTPKREADYHGYYTPPMRRIVERHYGQDLRAFGYQF